MRPSEIKRGRCRVVGQFLLLTVLVTVWGCGEKKVARYPVTGTVTVDGKPADGALVILGPVNPTPDVENLRPTGVADASGKFSLMTIDPGDGAPAGQYNVSIQWPAPAVADERGGRSGMGPDRLKGKYNTAGESTLTATVNEGPTELPPFELTSK
jgi:hypothetical protein